MALILCSNCRLPVNESVQRCPQCTARMATASNSRRVPAAAAALALVATVALLTRRMAA